MRKKITIFILTIAILTTGWWFWPRTAPAQLTSPSTAREIPREAPMPTPALPIIDQNTDLPAELNKLTLPNPTPAYQRLDETINSL